MIERIASLLLSVGWGFFCCWCFFVFTPMAIFCGNNRHKGRQPALRHSAQPSPTTFGVAPDERSVERAAREVMAMFWAAPPAEPAEL